MASRIIRPKGMIVPPKSLTTPQDFEQLRRSIISTQNQIKTITGQTQKDKNNKYATLRDATGSNTQAGEGLEKDGSKLNVDYDGSTIGINPSGKLWVPNGGISAAKIQTDAVRTTHILADNVTLSELGPLSAIESTFHTASVAGLTSSQVITDLGDVNTDTYQMPILFFYKFDVASTAGAADMQYNVTIREEGVAKVTCHTYGAGSGEPGTTVEGWDALQNPATQAVDDFDLYLLINAGTTPSVNVTNIEIWKIILWNHKNS